MTAIQYFWRHPLIARMREGVWEQGRPEARAEMILRILEWRGIRVTGTVRQRVEACTDSGQLEVWAL
ncbi:hypothetical protein [Streptomyces sp. NPDC017958]|uniref:hypothetical protein n=1 Tax=Streptomyces sp. NPDC017958 TaxID=3365021 RepID=UPI003798B0E5